MDEQIIFRKSGSVTLNRLYLYGSLDANKHIELDQPKWDYWNEDNNKNY